MHYLRLCLPLLLLSCAQLLAGGGSVVLEQGYESGYVYYMSTETKQENTIGIAGQTQKSSNDMVFDTTVAVQDGKDGGQVIRIAYERVYMKADMGAQAMVYDSAKPDPNSPFATMGELVGAEITLETDAEGEVVSVSGIDEMMARMATDTTVNQMLQGMIGEQQFKQMYEQSLLIEVPEEAISKGDSWEFEYDQDLGDIGFFSFSGEYEHTGYKEHEGHTCVQLGMTGTMDGKMTVPGLDPNAVQMDFTDFQGMILFDNELGVPRYSELEFGMKMKMSQQGMSMDMDMVQVITQQLTKVEEL